MPISRDRLDLRAVVEEVSAIHRHLIAEAKLELVTVYDIPEECYVWGDPLRIRQVLHNLIGNAVKFTELGTVRVTVSRDLTGEYLISVADTGIGIPAERQSAVFEDFEQADASTTRSFGGTGLGLPITRRLVERMGGTLTLESRMGEGTTITVRIRLAESASPQAAVAEDEVPNGLSILLAEDNELNALVITEQLLEFGCSVERCANGISALELYRDMAFDLVLLDIQMPLMDGLAVTRVMRERWPDRKTLIYALTANAFVDERDRASEAGMDGFVTKPMRREDLIALLQSVAQKIAEPR
jgi:hypothetical protein